MATAGEQGVIDDVMMKTIARWRLAAEGAFLNLSRLLKLELAGPWTHYCSVDGRPSVQPPYFDARAAGVPDTSRGKEVILSSQSRLSLGTI
jgi:hypothetical protein